MFSRFWWLLTLLPLAEIGILVGIGYLTSWPVPVGLVLGTGLAGVWILNRHGWPRPERLRTELAAGRQPGDLLLDKLFVLGAGLLLIVPGVLTDLAAMLLLVPATRNLVKRTLGGWFSRRFVGSFRSFSASGFSTGGASRRDEIIDVQVIESPRAHDAAGPRLEVHDPAAGKPPG